MPTRREMRTLQTRLQESRREVRILGGELNDLKDTVDELKQELTAKTDNAVAPAKTTVKKKRVAKKKATTSRKPD